MAVRLGLGLSHGRPLLAGAILVAIGLTSWFAGFAVVGVLLFVAGSTLLLERRRGAPSSSRES